MTQFSADRTRPGQGPLFTGSLLRRRSLCHALVLSLFTGVYDIFGADGGGEMFAITRIPRTIALVLAGAAMAMSGLVMQLLTQNRFVEPTTTGTTEWAGLGLLLVMILVPGASILQRMLGASIAAFSARCLLLFLRRARCATR